MGNQKISWFTWLSHLTCGNRQTTGCLTFVMFFRVSKKVVLYMPIYRDKH